jgi:hypothetical protein
MKRWINTRRFAKRSGAEERPVLYEIPDTTRAFSFEDHGGVR